MERKFTDKKAVLTYLESNPNALALEMRDALAPNLPLSTFRDALAWMKITYKKRDCVYSTRSNQKRRASSKYISARQ